MQTYLKTVYSESNTTIDSESGEVLDVQVKEKKILVETREEFIQVYTSIEAKIINMSLSEERVWMYTLLHCDKQNIIRITTYDKKIIDEKWGLSPSTVANSITKLAELGLLIRLERATYRVNPRYAWKGNSHDRGMMLTHVLTIECPHC